MSDLFRKTREEYSLTIVPDDFKCLSREGNSKTSKVKAASKMFTPHIGSLAINQNLKISVISFYRCIADISNESQFRDVCRFLAYHHHSHF